MGIYNFYHGDCPNCGERIEISKKWGLCSGPQDKTFVDFDDPFRCFSPGTIMPFPLENMKLLLKDPTCCCNTRIYAIFINNTLNRYEVAPPNIE